MGAEAKRINPSPRVPVAVASNPANDTRMGEINELMTIAGTVDSMPAASIHSASRREM